MFYREVKASERLPEEDGKYYSNHGEIGYDEEYKEFGYYDEEYPDGPDEWVKIPVYWWLEPIYITEDIEALKLKWQKHNRDNGLSWNEVAELVNEVVALSKLKPE